jgi:CsoR family transcriptional regulator, copper-sensing transcriptional repressor
MVMMMFGYGAGWPAWELPAAGDEVRVASSPGYASGKDDYLARLRKAEGQARGLAQVRGLRGMIEADSWWPDVVVQVASVTQVLQEVAAGLPPATCAVAS